MSGSCVSRLPNEATVDVFRLRRGGRYAQAFSIRDCRNGCVVRCVVGVGPGPRQLANIGRRRSRRRDQRREAHAHSQNERGEARGHDRQRRPCRVRGPAHRRVRAQRRSAWISAAPAERDGGGQSITAQTEDEDRGDRRCDGQGGPPCSRPTHRLRPERRYDRYRQRPDGEPAPAVGPGAAHVLHR